MNDSTARSAAAAEPRSLLGVGAPTHTEGASLTPARRVRLWTEFALLFFALPTAFWLWPFEMRPPMIPTLLVAFLVCLLVLLRDKSFDRRQLWHRDDLGRELKRVIPSFIGLAALLAAMVFLVERDRLFGFVRENPVPYTIVMIAYPVFSVFPQELLYRTFLFHRYGPLVKSRWTLIVMSAVAFGFMHIVFENWIAPVLTLGAGFLFAWTYARTKSTLIVSIEHALYGDFIWTIGLGWYFYGGAVGS